MLKRLLPSFVLLIQFMVINASLTEAAEPTRWRIEQIKHALETFDIRMTVETEVKEVVKNLRQLGLEPLDVDFMVAKNKHFYFIDFDFWNIHNDEGVWDKGVLKSPYKGCPLTAGDILRRIF